MSDTPTLTAAKLVRLLKKRGFVEVRQRGSHLHLMREGRPGLVTVPMHGGDLKTGTLRSILRQAGLTVQDLSNS